MRPPSKFEIMRINRAAAGFENEKRRILREIDCAELEALRTCRDEDELIAVAGEFAPQNPPIPANPQPLPQVSFLAPRSPGPLSRLFDWAFGCGARA